MHGNRCMNWGNVCTMHYAVVWSCGVQQGSVLRSLLFLIYINDLQYCSNKLIFHLFADDTNIHFSSKNLDLIEWNILHNDGMPIIDITQEKNLLTMEYSYLFPHSFWFPKNWLANSLPKHDSTKIFPLVKSRCILHYI